MSEPHNHSAAPADEAAPVNDDPGGAALVCEADLVQLDLAQDEDEDPFNAALQLGGVHPSGTELVVWLRLTPTTISQLLSQLQQLLHQQHTALGMPAETTDEDTDPDEDPGGAAAEPREGRIRRFLDPLGIRHLSDRSSRSTVAIGVAIAALMLLAFIIQLVRG